MSDACCLCSGATGSPCVGIKQTVVVQLTLSDRVFLSPSCPDSSPYTTGHRVLCKQIVNMLCFGYSV